MASAPDHHHQDSDVDSAPAVLTATLQAAEAESYPPKPTRKRAWPDQLVVTALPTRAFLRRRVAKGIALTPDQRRVALRENLLRVRFQTGTQTVHEYPVQPGQLSRQNRDRVRVERRARESDAVRSREQDDESISFFSRWLADSEEHARERAQALRTQLEGEAEPPKTLHLLPGSAKPHAPPQEQQEHQRAPRKTPSGSLRTLEPELVENLCVEPMPKCNIPKRTEPEDPPERIQDPPGPFSTAELIPDGVVDKVKKHGRQVQEALRRSRRGTDGWKAGKRLRPEALILSEEEALNECGRGFVWRKRKDEDLWDVVQPSSYPDNPPSSDLDVEGIMGLHAEFGIIDEQMLSWCKHGFPGARNMPRRVVIGYPHVGAMKHPKEFEEMNQRDIANNFVSAGNEFPEFWPTYVDPMNLVIQKGNPRATIDKTMQLSSSGHPKPVESYNDLLDLAAERAVVGKLSLPTTSVFARGSAILLSCGLKVKGGKFDLSKFYRRQGKQMAHVWQSGRVLETLFGHDFRVNFGEADAPDHTCRLTDALTFCVRSELRRLDREYPSKAPRVVEWLARRLGLAAAAGEEADVEFRWALMFFFFYYIDDAGLSVICDGQLVDTQGRPRTELCDAPDGTQVSKAVMRPELYFTASMAIVNRSGQRTPEDKRVYMDFRFELLGIDLDFETQRMLLGRIKRDEYKNAVLSTRKGKRQLQNGCALSPFNDTRSLVHKLIFAAAVIPLGRQHTFYLRKALRSPNRVEGNHVIIDARADHELAWWAAQLDKSEEHGTPFASRLDFPSSADDTIVRYSDASREETDPAASGLGAWAVVRDVFVYIEDRWTPREVARLSINVLEAKAKDIGGVVIIDYAKAVGCKVTHTLAYVDNSTAENVAEFGRTKTDGIHDVNVERQEWLVEQGIHESTERVASIDNDVADLLSRGDVDEALRFVAAAGIPAQRLTVPPEVRSTDNIPPTWDVEP
jgi:hypothetical protein